MGDAKKIQASLKKLHEKIKSAKEISEEDVRVAFVKSGILEELGYEGELRDIKFEKEVKGKRSDLLAFDEYRNVVFVIEFKKPDKIDLDEYFAQLWERYVKPLKARYGLLIDGLELVIYERVDSNWDRKPRINLGEITLSQCEEIYHWLKKPKIERTEITEVLKYFERFDKPEERINLSSEVAQKHFFESFELREGSVFVTLLHRTIGLFDFEMERSIFLKSAYNFWKASYAKKPEKVPENWRKIIEEIGLTTSEEDLYKFMFCLETAYSLFTRLILAKACEDCRLPYVDFSNFIKVEIQRIAYAQRGGITLLAWAVTARDLIENMKQKLVKSVFEGDIFYWWVDSYRELKPGSALYSPRHEKQKGYFGEALAEIILTLYKFDFSEIVGDPLGTLYQRYFDKETRKALGEFYTPREVVEYIIDAVGYSGKTVVDKRLLDPACGSGTFLVEALKRYLRAAEASGEDIPSALKKLCNEYHIVGLDIHPFATFMAQMQFMLVLIPAYKKAIEQDSRFVLNRLPIFRTDSLVDETKGEAKKVTLETFENGTRFILIDTGLPVNSGNLKIKMPYDKDVFSRTDLHNVQEYFAALQAVFDTVKESAWREKYEVDKEKLERNFKLYLQEKDWSKLSSFFEPYAQHFLDKFKELQETFGDGRLIKSIEDIILAALLKNYVKYDFVVGNPPYVRKELISPEYKKEVLEPNYPEVYHGDNDLFIYFMARGIKWLNEQAKFSFITSNKFTKTRYGKKIRRYLLENVSIDSFIDFGDTKVFADAINYPCIFVLDNSLPVDQNVRAVIVSHQKGSETELLNHIKSKIDERLYFDDFIKVFRTKQEELKADTWSLIPSEYNKILDKIRFGYSLLKEFCKVDRGIYTGFNEAFVVDGKTSQENHLEKDLLKPLLTGRDVKRFSIDYQGLFLIYTKDIDIDNYPRIKEYLEQFKDQLEKRWCVTDPRMGRKWFELEKPREPSLYETDKIITPDISIKNNFTFDKENFYCLNTAYVIIPKLKYRRQILFLLGLLNSKALEFYFKQISTHIRGNYYRYITEYLNQLPIKLPQIHKEEKLASKITEKVNLILEKVKLEQKIEKFPEEYIQEYRNRGIEFYSIAITFNSDHKAIESAIEKSIDGGFNILIGKKERPVFADSKVEADFVVTTLKGKRAKKGEKRQILVPKSDMIVEEILKKLEEDRANTESPSVAELEEEINELVYRLYGLDEEDKKVIEEFLERF